MRLSLNGWPPVASHIVAMLTGVSLANLSAQDPGFGVRSSQPESKAFIQVTLDTTRFADLPPEGKGQDGGMRSDLKGYIIALISNSGGECMVGHKPFEVQIHRKKAKILGERSHGSVLFSLTEIALGRSLLKVVTNRPKLELCQSKSMVVYEE
jgi:hypothetical protein